MASAQEQSVQDQLSPLLEKAFGQEVADYYAPLFDGYFKRFSSIVPDVSKTGDIVAIYASIPEAAIFSIQLAPDSVWVADYLRYQEARLGGPLCVGDPNSSQKARREPSAFPSFHSQDLILSTTTGVLTLGDAPTITDAQRRTPIIRAFASFSPQQAS